MAIKSREELLKSLNILIGDNSTDENLAILEDVTDTLKDYESKTADQTDWKTKYEQNDADWRKKYRERFTSGEEIKKEQEEDVEEDSKPRAFDSLFKEREG
nr:MAG TPA: hypothetical protein [Caudoviricetes sp.]